MFRIYLRDDAQQVSEKTVTGDPAAAATAFATLVDRADLDGRRLLAVITRDGRPVAYHKFTARPDDSQYYWRGRIDALPLNPA